MGAELPARTVRAITVALLAGMFVLGVATGLGVARLGGGAGAPQVSRSAALATLGLSADQQRQVDAIYARHRPELVAAAAEALPKARAIDAQVEAEIRAVLTPEQAKALDASARR